MKTAWLMNRTTRLQQNTALKRSVGLSAGTKRFARPDVPTPPKKPQRGRRMERRWYEQKAKQCAICGSRSNLKLHHVIYAQVVEREHGDISDPRNSLTLCVTCHDDHHASKPILLMDLRDENYAFAADTLGRGAAYETLRRRYVGGDKRLDRLVGAR